MRDKIITILLILAGFALLFPLRSKAETFSPGVTFVAHATTPRAA